MKAEASDGSAPRRLPWKSAITSVAVMVISASTVLGAVLLSLYGQSPSNQLVIRSTDRTAEEFIPTAVIATSPPFTFVPPTADVDTAEPSVDPSPTVEVDLPTGTPTRSLEINATSVPVATKTVAPSATPWPCAGGAPMHWKLYIVQQGDTLYSLARRHGTDIEQVIKYNCLTSHRVWTGQRLYLPVLATPASFATATLTATPISTLVLIDSPSPSPTPTFTRPPLGSLTPLPSETAVKTIRPTGVSTPTPLFTPSATATSWPTAEPTGTLSVRPTVAVTLTSTPTPNNSTLFSPLMPTFSVTIFLPFGQALTEVPSP